MGDWMDLVVAEAERQGFHVSQTQGTWFFRKEGNTLAVPTPNTPVDFMELRGSLARMGLKWPETES